MLPIPESFGGTTGEGLFPKRWLNFPRKPAHCSDQLRVVRQGGQRRVSLPEVAHLGEEEPGAEVLLRADLQAHRRRRLRDLPRGVRHVRRRLWSECWQGCASLMTDRRHYLRRLRFSTYSIISLKDVFVTQFATSCSMCFRNNVLFLSGTSRT